MCLSSTAGCSCCSAIALLPLRRCGEQGKRLVAQCLDCPECVTPLKSGATAGRASASAARRARDGYARPPPHIVHKRKRSSIYFPSSRGLVSPALTIAGLSMDNYRSAHLSKPRNPSPPADSSDVHNDRPTSTEGKGCSKQQKVKEFRYHRHDMPSPSTYSDHQSESVRHVLQHYSGTGRAGRQPRLWAPAAAAPASFRPDDAGH